MRFFVVVTMAAAASAAAPAITTLQDVASKIAPAPSAAAAAAEFSWAGGDPKPVAGALGAVYDVLTRERASLEAEQQAAAGQMMGSGSAGATRPAPADQRAVLSHMMQLTRSMVMQRAQGMMAFNQAVAALRALKVPREAAHRQIDARAAVEIQPIPFARVLPLGGCYSAENARRVHAIRLKFADEHVAASDRELAVAAAQAARIRALLVPVARDDDALMSDYAAVRPLFGNDMHMRAQYGGSALGVHAVTLGMYIGQFADAVREADLAAAQRAHARTVLQGTKLDDICR